MLTPTKKLFHAMEAVVYIACHQANAPVSSKEIAEIQELPPRYLEQMLQKLVRADILRGVRGPRGGYLLARERRRISLRDIYQVIEDEQVTADITEQSEISKTLNNVWQALQEESLAALEKVTLAELCDSVSNSEEKKKSKIADFTI